MAFFTTFYKFGRCHCTALLKTPLQYNRDLEITAKVRSDRTPVFLQQNQFLTMGCNLLCSLQVLHLNVYGHLTCQLVVMAHLNSPSVSHLLPPGTHLISRLTSVVCLTLLSITTYKLS